VALPLYSQPPFARLDASELDLRVVLERRCPPPLSETLGYIIGGSLDILSAVEDGVVVFEVHTEEQQLVVEKEVAKLALGKE
jgi:hypothetical protein